MRARDDGVAEPAAAGVGVRSGAAPDRLTGRSAVVALQPHWAGLHALAAVILRDRTGAQDVVQDALVGVLRSGAEFADETAALRYTRTAVINRCRTAMRRAGGGRRLWLVRPEHAPPADHKVLQDESRARVLALLHTLPLRQREVLTLRYLAHLDDAEIAEVLAIGASAVRSTASRALTALTQKLERAPHEHTV